MRTLTVFAVSLVFCPAVAGAQGSKGGQSGAFVAPETALEACAGLPADVPQHDCLCPTGAAAGSVWGSGPYTTDSDVCTAARHAGVVDADGGPVRLVRRPGQQDYTGSARNGVTTRDWGSYGESFDVVSAGGGFAGEPGGLSVPHCGTMPGDAERYRCSCAAGVPAGTVWGSGPYTADSDICTAARHGGALLPDASGTVTVLRHGGLDAYTGSDANGVSTLDWGSYDTSIVFDRN